MSQRKKLNIGNATLVKTLNKVSEYAIETYGNNCVVCAEVLSVENDKIEFHIISPGNKDALFNTSATVIIDIASGNVLEKHLYHSCKVSLVKVGL